MKITVKELVTLSMLGSLMFLGQYIFQFIPNIEVVSLFIIMIWVGPWLIKGKG